MVAEPRRFELVDDVCGACGTCNGKLCESARTRELRAYGGLRFTNDGFDCALPVTIDSHSVCSFGCAYCFSENSFGHVKNHNRGVGQTDLRLIERVFAGGGGKFGALVRRGLRYDQRNDGGFPCPIQLGAINDPCDNIERQQGWLLRFIRLAIKYNQPVRISTKGTVLLEPDYQREIAKAPHLFWIMFSIITPDEQLAARIERWAPSPQRRLEAMRAMSDLGCFTALRFRPVVPGASDSTPNYPHAWRTLIDRAADAGARAVTSEILYAPMRFHGEQRERWDRMERAIGVPIREAYRKMGRSQASLRPSATWSENILHAIAERGREHGMLIGISEPSWKQLNSGGCCCGMVKEHPVFGNFEPRNAVQAIIDGRDEGKLLTFDSCLPDWAADTRMSFICDNAGPGPTGAWDKRHQMYRDSVWKDWHTPTSSRNPTNYFQGAVERVVLEDGEVVYRYKGNERRHPAEVPFWRL